MGGVGNGAAEEDWRWNLNTGTTATLGENHEALAEWGPPGFDEIQENTSLGCSLLPRGLDSRRDFAWKKRGERTLAGGP